MMHKRMTASILVEQGVRDEMTEVELLTLQLAARSIENSARAAAVVDACQARLERLTRI